ncbi:lipopolysaccharide biosynthesis protein [Laspinema sp. A4]|uniref:lipopolysaccharide biosynthesis protein n=1 Tax=Laspinema sp. D2d TaxID=2953686 RepID=UPI0021BB3FD7|nr:lipopolysaccharide biosynthesis protein [Laspinema sp. D2d]MCT7984816.1 lipopolysaccharide biosynthesis protein [Laspinema sp. D2d]
MLTQKIKHIFSGEFIRNVGWLGGAELFNRIFRLATTVTLARTFSTEDYGLMAIVYTVVEFANVFTLRQGIGAKIIQAQEKDVEVLSNTAYWLNWILCILIFLGQAAGAFIVSNIYENTQLILPIITAGIMYLMMPFHLINSSLIQRKNRLKIIALCTAIQSAAANLITVFLALMGLGVWAIVWPMVLTTPVWIIVTWHYQKWRPPTTFTLARWQEITSFGGNLLGVELLGKVRGNIDYLIIGHFLGIDALGIYYLAFNAGLGISLNVINAFNSALFPYFCQVQNQLDQLKYRFWSSLKKTYLVIGPLILLQASLAPIYVPIIFGEKWKPAIPILIFICLSALPWSLAISSFYLLNATGRPHISLYWNIGLTLLFALVILGAVQGGIVWVAVAVLVYQFVTIPPFTLWCFKYVFKNQPKASNL